MAIDYVIGYDCVPKQTLGTDGILEREKGRNRAEEIIALYRRNLDYREPDRMGFEITRTNLAGEEETRLVIVQELIDAAAELQPLAHHCVGCPANHARKPFGCYAQIAYPISSAGEAWMLAQMPPIDAPLVWLLLKQGIQELGYDGASVAPLRARLNDEGAPVYFEERRVRGRDMVEFILNADQVFEMLFLVGTIQAAHAGILLLLFGAIERNLEAPQIVAIMNRATSGASTQVIIETHPFLLQSERDDDATIRQIKTFLSALYRAWTLNVPMGLDV